jgi:hypothetical protein
MFGPLVWLRRSPYYRILAKPEYRVNPCQQRRGKQNKTIKAQRKAQEQA